MTGNASVGVQGSQVVILVDCGTPAAAERLKAKLLAGATGSISLGGDSEPCKGIELAPTKPPRMNARDYKGPGPEF